MEALYPKAIAPGRRRENPSKIVVKLFYANQSPIVLQADGCSRRRRSGIYPEYDFGSAKRYRSTCELRRGGHGVCDDARASVASES